MRRMLALPAAIAAVHWSDAITLGSVIIGLFIGLITLGGIIYTVRRRGQIDDLRRSLELAHGAAESWESEYRAAGEKADRLMGELADAKVSHAVELAGVLEEQRELRHDLKNQLAAAQLEAATWREKTDQTKVNEGIQTILERISGSEATSAVIAALEKMEERGAARDAVLLENQGAITKTQERTIGLIDQIADRIVEKVGEVVEEKVRQIPGEPG